MFQNEYKNQLTHLEDLEDEKKKAYLKELQNTANYRGQTEWVSFFRGKELEIKGDFGASIKMYEEAFSISKELAFVEALIDLYGRMGDTENKDKWRRKQKNLVQFINDTSKREVSRNKEEIFQILNCHTEKGETVAERYIKDYIRKWKDVRSEYRSDLYILKKWSSSTPLMLQGIGKIKNMGGGIYIEWFGKGIVIDPGINFVQNLHAQKLSILNIDVVIVTHNHIDHNEDLKKIEDIKYQCTGSVLEDASLEFGEAEKKHIRRKIHYYLDHDTYQKFILGISSEGKNEYVHEFTVNFPRGKFVLDFQPFPEIKISYFKTIHGFTNTYGTVLGLTHDGTATTRTIGYTSDTKYFGKLGSYFKKVDVVIANISEITLDDLKKTGYKESHMGYHGCFDLANHDEVYPELFILSEFWGGKGDIRKIISEYLQYEIWERRKDVYILPGDLNLHIDLGENKIKCSDCQNFFDKKEIEVKNSDGENSDLHYLCPECKSKLLENK